MPEDLNRNRILLVLTIVFVTLAIYWQVLGHKFLPHWDDQLYITTNEAIKGLSLKNLRAAFTSYYVGNYAPFHIISYMLDYQLWGLNPRGFFLTNICLHAVNGMIFFSICRRLLRSEPAALIAALLFVCHPVQVESVAWATERKNLLAMTFFLWAFWHYLRYREGGTTGHYLASIVISAAALLTKSVTVIFPFVILAFEYCLEPRERRKGAVLRSVPFLLCALLVSAITLISQSTEQGGGRAPYHGGTPFTTLLTMLPVFARYVFLVLWPTGLSATYYTPIKRGIDADVAWAALLILPILAGMVYLFRRNRPLFFWAALIVLGLLPVSQIVPIATLMNDRYLYFPLLGVAGLCGHVAASQLAADSRRRIPVFATAGLLLLCLALLSFQRAGVWRSALTLWSDAAAKAPKSLTAVTNLGEAYLFLKEYDQASRAFARIQEMDPGNSDYEFYQGLILADKGDYEGAISFYRKGLMKEDMEPRVLYQLALALEKTGQIDEAVRNFNNVLLTNNPELRPKARIGIDRLWPVVSPRLQEEQRKLAVNPKDAATLGALALALDNLGFYDEALKHYASLTAEVKGLWQAYFNMGNICLKLKRFQDASRYFEKSLELNPKNLYAISNLGHAYLNLKDFPRAAAQFERAMLLDPGYPFAPFDLAKTYMAMKSKGEALKYFRFTEQKFPDMKVLTTPFVKQLEERG